MKGVVYVMKRVVYVMKWVVRVTAPYLNWAMDWLFIQVIREILCSAVG